VTAFTDFELRIGEIFDEYCGCDYAIEGALWCYWPNSTETPCEHCAETMARLQSVLTLKKPIHIVIPQTRHGDPGNTSVRYTTKKPTGEEK
jgi:hypothetical protein